MTQRALDGDMLVAAMMAMKLDAASMVGDIPDEMLVVRGETVTVTAPKRSARWHRERAADIARVLTDPPASFNRLAELAWLTDAATAFAAQIERDRATTPLLGLTRQLAGALGGGRRGRA